MANAKALSDEARAKGVTVADAGAFEVPEDPAVVSQETGTPLYDVQLKEYVTWRIMPTSGPRLRQPDLEVLRPTSFGSCVMFWVTRQKAS